MKTLILFGAARRNGRTKKMMDLLMDNLEGEVTVIDAYRAKNIGPCIDCRFCWKKRECAVKDDMQDIYKLIDEADNIVVATPVYFHSVTGKLKIIIDRLQMYWAAHVRNDKPENYIKKGAFLFTGGAPDFEDQFLGTEIVCKNLFEDMAIKCVGQVCMPNTDLDDLSDRNDLEQEIIQIAKRLSREEI